MGTIGEEVRDSALRLYAYLNGVAVEKNPGELYIEFLKRAASPQFLDYLKAIGTAAAVIPEQRINPESRQFIYNSVLDVQGKLERFAFCDFRYPQVQEQLVNVALSLSLIVREAGFVDFAHAKNP